MLIIVIQQIYMSRVHSVSQYQSRMNSDGRRSSAYSQYSSTPTSQPTQINSIIECMLCAGAMRQSHMCPACCKMFCQVCIKNWIKAQKPECPNCFKHLDDSNLLNCSILGRQIQQALSKSVAKIRNPTSSTLAMLSPIAGRTIFSKNQSPYQGLPQATKNQSICQKHQLQLIYYCQQCKLGLCSDCAVLNSNHQNHRLCRISHKKLKFKQNLSEIFKQLSHYKAKAIAGEKQIMQATEKIKLAQKEKLSILNAYLNQIFTVTSQKNDKLICQRNKILQQMIKNYEEGCKIFNTFEQQTYKVTKTKLVKEAQNIKKQIIKNTQYFNFVYNPDPILIESQIVPTFQQKTYILDNYNYLKEKGDALISEPLFYMGTQWKLKIFPGGIANESNIPNQQFLALRLQMSKGFQNENLYRCRIELVNQLDRAKCMSFQFENDFKEGSEWGLDKFIKISSLYNEKYIHPSEGYLEIILYVRCLSYFHAVRDQAQIIKARQWKQYQNSLKLNKLKQKAIQLGLKSESKTIRSSRIIIKQIDKSNSISSKGSDSKRTNGIDDLQ